MRPASCPFSLYSLRRQAKPERQILGAERWELMENPEESPSSAPRKEWGYAETSEQGRRAEEAGRDNGGTRGGPR